MTKWGSGHRHRHRHRRRREVYRRRLLTGRLLGLACPTGSRISFAFLPSPRSARIWPARSPKGQVSGPHCGLAQPFGSLLDDVDADVRVEHVANHQNDVVLQGRAWAGTIIIHFGKTNPKYWRHFKVLTIQTFRIFVAPSNFSALPIKPYFDNADFHIGSMGDLELVIISRRSIDLTGWRGVHRRELNVCRVTHQAMSRAEVRLLRMTRVTRGQK